MNIEAHDYIIVTIIAAIIVLQFLIFLNNLKKIRSYKKTIEKAQNFQIIEVSVPEDWIKEIEVDEILRDPGSFQELSANYSAGQEILTPESEIENAVSEELISDVPLQNNSNSINKENSGSEPSVTLPEDLEHLLEDPEEEEELLEFEEEDFLFDEEEPTTKSKL